MASYQHPSLNTPCNHVLPQPNCVACCIEANRPMEVTMLDRLNRSTEYQFSTDSYCPIEGPEWLVVGVAEKNAHDGLDASGEWIPYGDHHDWLMAIMGRMAEVGYTRKYWASYSDYELIDHGYQPCEWPTGAEWLAEIRAEQAWDEAEAAYEAEQLERAENFGRLYNEEVEDAS